jgi:hypothetical protein
VVAQVEAWHSPGQVVLLHPHFYDLTYAYHLNKSAFFGTTDVAEGLARHRTYAANSIGDREVRTTLSQVILVVSGDERPAITRTLGANSTVQDSVEADHKVWVYRFRR